MNKNITFLLVGLLVIAGGLIVWQSAAPEEHDMAAMPNDTANALEGANETMSPPTAVETAPGVKEFTVTGTNFAFDATALTVKKGDTVRITFKNMEGFHDWKIDEFSAATTQFKSPGEETIEFVADKAGSFEYYCSVGKHRAMGMKGTLTVTE
ncbi:MAG: plastocyanin/azurin family copper-binding protein [Patescibacteria group bacterium]